ncbi:TIGR00341 family protein [Natrinema salsiterrestre]|uniref:TIGR00341 family protein n=1 Tax=Natrinema salsiterrestre TaxID=2950540 RepID=A0A9Q4KXP1_9EURY|nr:TIGR00341 family protein [Natrinema salsiterrestre]MDF9745403.1 TIGR00341 family protein [Natrinema salsiterrestre]
MRLLTVLAPTQSNADEVTAVLERHNLEYSLTDHTNSEKRTITVPAPEHAIEPLEDDLASIGDVTIIVEEPMAIIGSDWDESSTDGRREWLSFERISRSELRSKAQSQLPSLVIFAAMTAISGVVATTGVLLDSLAVLVGAMVIAPLLGPAMASSVATVLDERQLFVRGVKLQLVGIGVAMSSALAFALFARTSRVITTAVDLEASLGLGSHGLPPSLLVTVAVCSGIAGGLGMATTGITDLIGVMIAAAIMPPIGVIGVGIAWNAPEAVIGSFVVVAVNVIAINVGAIATLWTVGFHPTDRSRIRTTRGAILRRILLLTGLLLVATRLLEIVSDGL